jgi:hypothetical protein
MKQAVLRLLIAVYVMGSSSVQASGTFPWPWKTNSFGPDVKVLSETENSALCRLTILHNTGMSSCSATLISANQAITATHCFPLDFDTTKQLATLTCAKKYGSEIAKVFRMNALRAGIPSDDMSVMDLETPIPDSVLGKQVKPIRVAQYPHLYFSAGASDVSSVIGATLKPDVDCWVAGYGKSKKEPSGILRGFPIRPDRSVLRVAESQIFPGSFLELRAPAGKTLENSVDAGDSGGSLICRSSPKADYELIAVNSSQTYLQLTGELIANRFTPVFSLAAKEFLQRVLK